ncbi:MAG: 4-hydroxy-3-methylbut-2-enyl diphosphate reductase [Candidatus Marinimicrobia bacterium]|nr:4-hydroxy-3-methylbut-2-enyl diphosphate reductase [Candidatus Neomarinimicrobiota bacterium]
MNIQVAEHCGFCSGVKNAIELAYTALNAHDQVAILGDLVHNETVMDELKQKGLVHVNSLEEVGDMPLLLRAHGTDTALIYAARKMGLHIIDGTCPLVTEIHRHAQELESEGRQIIVIGDKQHDEVKGIVSRLHDYCVVAQRSDLDECRLKRRTGVVIQSTQRIENVQEIVPNILTKTRDCRIINTICEPTRRNQEEIRDLAEKNDCVLVIGDSASANSKRLFIVAKSLNKNSYMVANKEEIHTDWFRSCASVGITAGASTPRNVIDSIILYIKTLSGDKQK